MRVCVASTNPVKIAAVQGALTKSFPGDTFDVVGKSVFSGVADQPMTDIETRQVFVLCTLAGLCCGRFLLRLKLYA